MANEEESQIPAPEEKTEAPISGQMSKRGILPFFAEHPAFGLVTFVVGVIGTLASVAGVWLFLNEKPSLCYCVNPSRTPIIKYGSASTIKVLAQDQELKSDVTAVQIAIWNSGKKAIRTEGILKPILIKLAQNVRILEVAIKSVSRDVVHLQLATEQLPEGIVGVSFRILEKNDGGVIQIIYAGSPVLGINCEGIVEGQGDVNKGAIGTSLLMKTAAVFLVWEGIFVLFTIIAVNLTKRNTPLKAYVTRHYSVICQVFLVLSFVCVLIFVLFDPCGGASPPFGF